MNLRRTLVYFPAYAKGYLRSPVGLFFSLIFPVILILIFGAVFSSSGSSTVPLTVENLDHNSPASVAFLSALNDTGTLSITVVSPDVGNLSDYLAHNDLSAGLVIPAGFNASLAACAQHLPSCAPTYLLVFTNPSSGSEAGIVEGAVQGVANGMNLHLVGGSVVVTPVNLNVGNPIYRYIDYLVPGLIGFSVLVGPMFSMVNVSSTWKRDKLFRQLSLTPLSRSEWLTATFLWYVLLAIVSTLCLLGVGRFLFGAHVTLTLLALPFLVVGPVLFVALGLLAGSVSSTPESAAVIGNIITFPMMFLSGTFFPVSMFPSWLVPVAHVLPLYYVIDGLNAAMVFGNASAAYFDLAVVLVVAIAFSVAASHVFNWRED